MAIYDAVVIGSGPGGYWCAIKVAQLDGKVAIVEKNEIGGVCVNTGCIPTKALYESAKIFSKYKKSRIFSTEQKHSVNYGEVLRHKDTAVRASSLGVKELLDSYGVRIVNGAGKIIDKNNVEVGNEILETRNIVIATGSAPFTVPGVEIDHKTVIDSTDALSMRELPKDIIVCGGGYIGAELAGIFNKFGVKVTIVEMLPRIIATQDTEISEQLKKEMERSGITIMINTKISKVSGNTVEIVVDGKRSELTAEKILVVFGRKPVIYKEELDKIGVKYDKGIIVDSHMKTNVRNVYAIGDVTNIMMLAHVASAQGEVAAENMMGMNSEMDYIAIPSSIFTFPEIGSVGMTSQDAKDAKIGKVPFAASGKARASGEIIGFVKVVSKYDRIVGAHIIGPDATELVAEATLAIKNRLTTQQIIGTVHAHPTLAESFAEAVRDIDSGAINLPSKKKNVA